MNASDMRKWLDLIEAKNKEEPPKAPSYLTPGKKKSKKKKSNSGWQELLKRK